MNHIESSYDHHIHVDMPTPFFINILGVAGLVDLLASRRGSYEGRG